MDARELRIGNWIKIREEHFKEFRDSIYSDYLTNEFEIKGWNDGSGVEGCKQIAFYEIPNRNFGGLIHSGILDRDIEPVTVTEEKLLRLGFVRGKDFGVYHNVFYLYGFMVSLDDYINVFVDWADDGPDSYHSIVCYEELYLHQLQNLYFALTFKELTFLSTSKV